MHGQQNIKNVLHPLISATVNNATANRNLNVNILSLPRNDHEKLNAKNEY